MFIKTQDETMGINAISGRDGEENQRREKQGKIELEEE